MADVPEPAPAPGEALLGLRLGGVCNTDLEIVRGYMGFEGTLGHELVADVLACDARRETFGYARTHASAYTHI